MGLARRWMTFSLCVLHSFVCLFFFFLFIYSYKWWILIYPQFSNFLYSCTLSSCWYILRIPVDVLRFTVYSGGHQTEFQRFCNSVFYNFISDKYHPPTMSHWAASVNICPTHWWYVRFVLGDRTIAEAHRIYRLSKFEVSISIIYVYFVEFFFSKIQIYLTSSNLTKFNI